jgi:cytidylate kinase
MEKNEYIDILSKIMKKIAAEGNAVVVGRSGQHFLKNHENVYHVLILADQKDRVKFMQEHYDLSSDKALEAVKKEDTRRKILFRILGTENFDQPDIYHLVLNMSKVDLQLACELICELPGTQAEPQQGIS